MPDEFQQRLAQVSRRGEQTEAAVESIVALG
jgi:hypothetical protein